MHFTSVEHISSCWTTTALRTLWGHGGPVSVRPHSQQPHLHTPPAPPILSKESKTSSRSNHLTHFHPISTAECVHFQANGMSFCRSLWSRINPGIKTDFPGSNLPSSIDFFTLTEPVLPNLTWQPAAQWTGSTSAPHRGSSLLPSSSSSSVFFFSFFSPWSEREMEEEKWKKNSQVEKTKKTPRWSFRLSVLPLIMFCAAVNPDRWSWRGEESTVFWGHQLSLWAGWHPPCLWVILVRDFPRPFSSDVGRGVSSLPHKKGPKCLNRSSLIRTPGNAGACHSSSIHICSPRAFRYKQSPSPHTSPPPSPITASPVFLPICWEWTAAYAGVSGMRGWWRAQTTIFLRLLKPQRPQSGGVRTLTKESSDKERNYYSYRL